MRIVHPERTFTMSLVAKEKITALLKERKYDEIAEMVLKNKGNIRSLRRLLYEPGTLLCWRAIEAMGVVAERLAAQNPEAVRIILRHLLWSINEESGGIGWSAPECIGEIVSRRPDLFGDYASIIISYAGEDMLRRGVIWAAGRIAQARPNLVAGYTPALAAYLDDPDPVVRGYTLRLLDTMGEKLTTKRYAHLMEDRNTVPIYENDELHEITVAALAGHLIKTPGD
ncbi:MAG: HEAT repeat domain-containing protein [Firmicutes bacterium]|nr:HEAT repeat domain-containing protein [Bacillota bacterium]